MRTTVYVVSVSYLDSNSHCVLAAFSTNALARAFVDAQYVALGGSRLVRLYIEPLQIDAVD